MTRMVFQNEAKNLDSTNLMLSRFFILFGHLNDNCGAGNGFFEGKMRFFENFSSKCLQVRKKAVPLHRF